MIRKSLISLLVLLSIYAIFYLSNITYASIQKIYVINLDRSPERFAHMQKTLDSMELPVKYSRFSAIDGKNIKFIDKNTNDTFTGEEIIANQLLLSGNFNIQCSSHNQNYISGKLNWTYFHPRAIGELSHTCSSRKIWQEIIDQNYENALIMEDDVTFIPNFSDLLEVALDNAPKDYDMLYLNIGNFGKAYKSNVKNNFLRIFMNAFDQHIKNPFWKQARRNIRSAKAYIVSKKGAEKLLTCTQELPSGPFLAADVVISKCIEREEIISYVSKPQFIHGEESFKSDIGE